MRLKFVPSLVALLFALTIVVSCSAIAQQVAQEERGWLGAQLQGLSEQSVKALGLTRPNAILTINPLAGGPAQKAGLLPADVIVELDGMPVPALQDFISGVQQVGTGRDVRLGIWRRGERSTIQVMLGSSSEGSRLMASPQFAERDAEQRIKAFAIIVQVFGRDRFPELWSATQHNIGDEFLNRGTGERAENVEKAIAAYEAALTVRSREADPALWAHTQHNLGLAYRLRSHGEPSITLRREIAALEAALTARVTRDASERLGGDAEPTWLGLLRQRHHQQIGR